MKRRRIRVRVFGQYKVVEGLIGGGPDPDAYLSAAHLLELGAKQVDEETFDLGTNVRGTPLEATACGEFDLMANPIVELFMLNPEAWQELLS